MTNPLNLTDASLKLFLAYAKDAGNWNGIPMVGANVPHSKNDDGNLTDLKKKGLVTTDVDEGCTWLHFTPAGVALAAEFGFEIDAPF